jgi:hypothetical protein
MDDREAERLSGLRDQHEQENNNECLCGELLDMCPDACTYHRRCMMKILSWHIGIVWEDGTEEYITDMPDWVATRVDEFLTELEEGDDD